MYTDNKLLLGT